MNVFQLYIWNYWRCVEKQLSWCCFLPWNLLPPPWKWMNVFQLYIWNYWRCVEEQLSWCCFYLEISRHRLENGWKFSSFTFGITGDVSRNSWVGDPFTLKSPATALKMDERFPALHLELLEMCRETVELVTLLPWNLLPPPWKFLSFLLQLQFCLARLPRLSVAICFCSPLLRCCWRARSKRLLTIVKL